MRKVRRREELRLGKEREREREREAVSPLDQIFTSIITSLAAAQLAGLFKVTKSFGKALRQS